MLQPGLLLFIPQLIQTALLRQSWWDKPQWFVLGPQNSKISAGLRLELGVRSEKTCEPLRCQFAWRRVRATLKNTSCRNSRPTGFMGSGWDVWGREARKSACSEESKRGDSILGPLWWDSHRQERPRLLVPICSLERPLPRVTVVPQYHLSARPIRLWDKAASLSLGPLNTAGGERSQVTYLIKLEKVY